MAYDHVVSWRVQTPGGPIASSKTYTGSSDISISESVANGQTNKQINVAIDVTAVKSFYLLSDRNVTLETNDGSSPDDTIALIANVPYVWTTDSYDSFLLGTDVTAVFITNSSGSTANIEMRILQDATP